MAIYVTNDKNFGGNTPYKFINSFLYKSNLQDAAHLIYFELKGDRYYPIPGFFLITVADEENDDL